ncbi:helix-turn-helix transcriptional regulator [Nocardioides sp.]|uniref:helix-turn-helix transcriptional regulator n=1 Tax=Nocardioides sp. TaxID=35761 RepID=UPI003563A13A
MSSPAAGAKDQVARLLTLVPYLHSRGHVRLDEAAKDLGVPATQLMKDLKVLLMCGLPGGYPDDLIDVDLDALEGPEADGLIRVSNADYLARPMRLNTTEATALIVALRALRSGAGEQTREVVDRALAKLEAAAATGAEAALVDPGVGAADADQALLATRLQRAADQQRQVLLSYYVPARDERSDRVVDPRGVVNADGHAYLDAWCHLAEAPRLFRLDRIERAEVLEEPITTEPTAPRDLGVGFFTHDSRVSVATLLIAPSLRWVSEQYPVQEVRERADGRLEVDLLVADSRWLVRFALGLAPYVEILSPRESAEALSAAAQQALSNYR